MDGKISIHAAVNRLKDLAASDPDLFKQAVAGVLDGVDPSKPYGTILYDALARVTISVAFEAVVLRRGGDGVLRVFLRRRAMDDTAYPGEWHAPGSVLRPGESFDDVFHRLEGEFGGKVTSWKQFELVNVTTEKRGHFVTPYCLVEIEGDGRRDDTHGWYPVNELPEPMVGHHSNNVIPAAVREFRRWVWMGG